MRKNVFDFRGWYRIARNVMKLLISQYSLSAVPKYVLAH